MSKGSKQRPTDTKKYDENYDKIFRKPKEKNTKMKAQSMRVHGEKI